MYVCNRQSPNPASPNNPTSKYFLPCTSHTYEPFPFASTMGGRAYTGRTYALERSSTLWTAGVSEDGSSGCVTVVWVVLGWWRWKKKRSWQNRVVVEI